MNLEDYQVNDLRLALQRYYYTGPMQSLKILIQLSKAQIQKDVLISTEITRTVATLARKLAGHEDEDDREVAELASKLTSKWKRIF